MYELRSPTVKRRRIAKELATLRERAGLTRAAAAKALDMSPGNLGRIENREITARPVVVRAALALYGVTGDDAEALVELARGATERGWWQNYGDVLPDWFGFYVGLEEEAASIATYESEIVPGLFQTADYAREIFRLTTQDSDIEPKVAARLRRQEILTRADPVEVTAVLNEAVLLRPVGTAAQFRAQLEHLAGLFELPNVSIQVLPFAAGGHAAMTGPFMVIKFPDALDEPIVYLDNFTRGQVLEEPEHFTAYQDVHSRLRKLSLSPEESLDRIRVLISTIG
ncbi:helix-turn-helix domain-containing protein [Glycomyces albidus]|jgi:transcriptional regulator with XRE-family HTH domain|uniref:Helix-turn-helix domain-containing protein n=1 Tax=Glycomyces albidus TaxID=2656774 RepID=A0A6L5G6E9_9ACTN|nr:helix-turn-helix transcriptional regulator [Glycomyces albidus]MQM25211.1 helix-turn-helix domain-containing protein [Glycomyces albidus]